MERIARFERVSEGRFAADWADAFPDIPCPWEALRLPRRATAGSAGYDFFAPAAFVRMRGWYSENAAADTDVFAVINGAEDEI